MKFTCVILLLSLLVFVSGCKKKENEIIQEEEAIYQESQLIGQWIYNEIKLNGNLMKYEHTPNCGKDRFYFLNRPSQDHNYVEIIYMNSNCATTSTNMDWKIKGKNLLLNFGTQVFTYQILKLNEKNFDVSIKIDFDSDGKTDDLEIYAIKSPCTTGDPYCQ